MHALVAVVVVASCAVACSRSSSTTSSAVATPVVPADAPPVDATAVPVDAALDASPDAPPLAIVDAPIAWSPRREELTLAYRRAHSDAAATDLAIAPRVIVLHYTAGGSAAGTRRYFDNVEIEASRTALRKAGRVNVSSHYLVDRDGTIYRLQPDTRFARHCIGLNHIAIGVENVGDEKRWPLTEAQVTANAALVRELSRTHAITHLLGHHEVMAFKQHPYFVELDPAYGNEKGDPGVAFMEKVRAAVADLGLEGGTR